jgi:hypothetical protein
VVDVSDITLSPAELVELTGCKRPADQMRVLHERGFVRAALMRGFVVLERAHYEGVLAGTYGRAMAPSAEEVYEPEGWHPWRAGGVSPEA